MKQITFTQHFKVTQASNKSAKPEQIGKKRESIEIGYAALELMDVQQLREEQQIKVAEIVNNAIETYAKKLMLQNGADWDYIPSAEILTVDSVYADLTAERKGGSRILTKESLAAFAIHYAELAVSFLNKSVAGANSGSKVIQEKLKPILGNPAALATFTDNLTQILECPEFDSSHADVVEALLVMITEVMDQEIDMDAL